MESGVEVWASTVSLRSSGGAEEGDEAEDGVWGGAACRCVMRANGGRDGEMEKMREMEKMVEAGDGGL